MSPELSASRYRLLRPKFLVGLALCIAAIVAAALVVFGPKRMLQAVPGVGPSGPDVPYVYVKSNEVTLVRDGRAAARHPGSFGSIAANLRDNLAWTHNARYFAILDGNDDYGDLSARQLIIFDVLADQVRTVPCPNCASLAPIGDQQVMIGQRKSSIDGDDTRVKTRVLRLSLDSNRPPILIQSNLPELTNDMRMVAGTHDNVLVAGSNTDEISHSGGGPEKLFFLNAEGAARPIGDTAGNVLVGLTAVSSRPNEASKLAIDTGVRTGFCTSADIVSVVDGTTGGSTETANYPLVAPGRKAGIDAGFQAHDLWWDDDGALYATFEAWECDDAKPNPRVVKIPPTVWRLDGNSWTKIDTETILSERCINEDHQLSLIPSEFSISSGDYSTGNTLYTETRGEKTRIADGVLFVSTPGSCLAG